MLQCSESLVSSDDSQANSQPMASTGGLPESQGTNVVKAANPQGTGAY